MNEVPDHIRVDEISRIVALPQRPPLDCTRRPGSRLWSPHAEALVEVVTRRYARVTSSCACVDRHIVRRGDRVVVTYAPPQGLPPLPPVEVSYHDLYRDVLDPATRRQLADLRDGGVVDLPGLGRPCIRSLNPVQAWALREFPRAQGIFGLAGVGSGKCLGVSTPIRMHDGTVKPVEQIITGDLLAGVYSPRRVLSTTRGRGSLRKIIPIDGGSPWVCNDVHVLTLVDSFTEEVFDVPLDQYMRIATGDGYACEHSRAHPTPWQLFRIKPNRGDVHQSRIGFHVEPIGDGDYFGFTLDGDGRFLLEDGTVTHNTFLSLLAPLAVDCKTAIILIKPDQRIHYRAAYLRLREHFRVPSLIFDRNDSVDTQGAYIVDGAPTAHVIPYSLLSNPKSTTLLEQIAADTVIADEWHLLANRGSTRTTRFLRYMSKEPCKRLAGWSGSTIKKSVKDAAHLAAHSLGLASPYPIKQDDVEAFGAVIDPSPMPDRTSPTARRLLAAFGKDVKYADDPAFAIGLCGDGGIREGFRERVFSTLGVIATSASSAPCSLTIKERVITRMPEDVCAKLAEARLGHRPDGEELTEAVEITACARTVAAGYYHYWAYPRNEPIEIREDWFAKRQAWNRELRAKLIYGETHLDSPHLCANAAERAWRDPRYEGSLPVWPADNWPAWIAIKDAIEPDPRTRVFDDFLASDAAAWATEHRGIVWVQSRAFGQRIAELAGINYHGGGPDAESRIHAEDGKRSIVVSLKAHGESRDELQFKFYKQLFAEVMSSADRWEQALGRLVRQGQLADTVETWVYRHVSENRDAFRNAVMYAEYIEATTPNKQLILAADCEFEI